MVCSWNPTGEYAENTPSRERREAYLVAPISSVDPTPDEPGRYIIRFREFARVSRKNAWPYRQRNPVTYTTLHDLEINPDELTFEPCATQPPKPAPSGAPAAVATSSNGVPAPLTIAAAKRGLAVHYGVEPDAIEIIIRG